MAPERVARPLEKTHCPRCGYEKPDEDFASGAEDEDGELICDSCETEEGA